MNIICDGKLLRHIKEKIGHAYSLDELAFFIDKKYLGYKFFMIITDGKRHDAVELRQVNSTSKDYYTYACAMNSTVKITSGECEYSILGVAPGATSPEVNTDSAKLRFNNTVYNFKAQINLIEQFSKASAEIYKSELAIYEKMVALSKLNIEMLEDGGATE